MGDSDLPVMEIRRKTVELHMNLGPAKVADDEESPLKLPAIPASARGASSSREEVDRGA